VTNSHLDPSSRRATGNRTASWSGGWALAQVDF